MKKGFLYYCLLVSLILHALLVLFVRLETPEKKKEKEPIAIDIVGPLKKGAVTRLPKTVDKAGSRTITPKSQARILSPKVADIRPSFPSLPIPASPPSVQAKAQAPAPAVSHEGIPGPVPGKGQQAQPDSAPSQAVKGSAPSVEKPRRLVLPDQEDLQKYAKLDRDMDRLRDDETVTLDTEDLMYTSYLQGLKRRIELIWKYPETARRDGLQGNLVMKFSIAKSGRVENIELIKSSGYPVLDEAAKQALIDANPFNPLPDNWKKDNFTITGTFMYRLYGLYLR